jgi:putative IMPACT (imprinted ancient) family translation regulator
MMAEILLNDFCHFGVLSNLEAKEQYYRYTVAKTIKAINQTRNNNNNNNRRKTEWKIITKIKQKLTGNKLIIVKADKGGTTVILTEENYPEKVNNFIQCKI